jgi:hypothetical protein
VVLWLDAGLEQLDRAEVRVSITARIIWVASPCRRRAGSIVNATAPVIASIASRMIGPSWPAPP